MNDQAKNKMTAAIEHYKNDLKNIRTDRANPGMVEHIMVEVYGSMMPLKNIASISVPEARLLLITPFDASNTNQIGNAISKSNIGFSPIVGGNEIKVKIPPMTEEIRKKMIKLCHEEKEKAKVTIRNIRRDANEAIKKQKTAGEITDDLEKKYLKNVQELTDKFCKEADELAEKKEKEISM